MPAMASETCWIKDLFTAKVDRWDIPGWRGRALKFMLSKSIEFPSGMYPCGWVGQETLSFSSALIIVTFKYKVNKTYTKFKLT